MRRLPALATLPLVAPLVAGAAFAQAAPTPAQAPDLSPAATAALTKLRQGDPLLKQLYGQLRAANAEMQLAAQRPAIDPEQIAALIRRADGLQAQFRSRQSDGLIAALHGLAPADRGPFLRAIGIGAPAPRPR